MFDLKALRRIPGRSAFSTMQTPVGELTLLGADAGLQAVLWGPQRRLCTGGFEVLTEAPDHPVLQAATDQIGAFFSGDRRVFDLPLDLHGTLFQKQVWALLLHIPYGETRFYGDLANQLGDAGKTRAVGMASASNPASIVVPCHRLIGKSGALTGYAGGTDVKAALLRMEREHCPMTSRKTAQLDLF